MLRICEDMTAECLVVDEAVVLQQLSEVVERPEPGEDTEALPHPGHVEREEGGLGFGRIED